MKTILRFAIMLTLTAVLCLCLGAAAYAEDFVLSDMETFDAHGVYVDEENFPDAVFRQFILNNYGSYLSTGEIASATVIDCSQSKGAETAPGDIFIPSDPVIPYDDWVNPESDNQIGEAFVINSDNGGDDVGKIKSLKGIELFTQLQNLYCGGNALSNLDLSMNTALTFLDCSDNKLTSLDLSRNTELRILICAQNQLTALELSNNQALTTLYCGNNLLDGLDLSENTALEDLRCGRNTLGGLDLSRNAALTTLYCPNADLSELDLSGNAALRHLGCQNNQITALDLSVNRVLEVVSCGGNQLKSLDVQTNPLLRSLACEDNLLVSLLLGEKSCLSVMNCAGNALAYLSIEDCPVLTELCADTEAQHDNGVLSYGRWPDSDTLIVDETVKLIPINCYSISETNFPDKAFRQYIAAAFDTDGDTFLCKDEMEAVVEMDCSGLEIRSLKGLAFFGGLKKLNCVNNSIEYLSVSPCAELLSLIDRTEPVFYENRISYADEQGYLLYDADTVLTDTAAPERNVNAANFPDRRFQEYVSTHIDLDANDYLSEDETAAVTWVDCSGSGEERESIKSLQGIALFPNLVLLDCSYNWLQTLDLSGNPKLKTLDCSNNTLIDYLDLSANTALETVWCYSNRLEDVDLGTNENLIELWCNDNDLAGLDLSGLPKLKALWSHANRLAMLDISGNTELETLSCSSNCLADLDISHNAALTTLWCSGNELTGLNLTHNPALKRLGCEGNHIRQLDITPCAALCELVKHGQKSQNTFTVYYFDESTDDPSYLRYDSFFNPVTLITMHGPDFILPSSLTAIEAEAFAGDAFTYVLVPAGVEAIGSGSFANCPDLRYVEIQGAQTAISDDAFGGRTDFTIIAPTGSAAETWANQHGVSFQPAA